MYLSISLHLVSSVIANRKQGSLLLAHSRSLSVSREPKNMAKKMLAFAELAVLGTMEFVRQMSAVQCLFENVLEPRLARIEDRDSIEPAKPQRDVIPLDHTTVCWFDGSFFCYNIYILQH